MIYKLADGLNVQDASLNQTSGTRVTKADTDIYCVHCEELKHDLQKAKLEISCYKVILKLMQEERSEDSPTCKTTTAIWNKESDSTSTHKGDPVTNGMGPSYLEETYQRFWEIQ